MWACILACSLRERWIKALDMLERDGEEHPPVVGVNAWKKAYKSSYGMR